MPKIQNNFKVISNKRVFGKYFTLSFDGKAIQKSIKPGQFIHIRISDGLEPFFRRPFSVCRAKNNVEIFYDVVGKGTKLLSEKKPGDMLDVLGPLGNHFHLPGKGIRQVVMIAGGIGIAPFMIHSDVLSKKKIELVLLFGARTKDHVFSFAEFKKNGCKVFVATEDGSVGTKGRVSKLFSKIKMDPKETMIYTCGPKPMMAAVQDFAVKHNLSGQASLEEVMACGLGACLGCSIPTANGYRTVCHDGPVFELDEVIF